MSQDANGQTDTSTTEPGTPVTPDDGDKSVKSEPSIETVGEDFSFKLPEGFDSEAEQGTIDGLKSVFQEVGISVTAAQTVFDKLVSMQDESVQFQKQQRDEAVQKARDEIKKDPDIGGANYEKVSQAVDKLLIKFGGADLHKSLVEHGIKDDIAFMKMFNNINKVLSEDTVITPTHQTDQSPRDMTDEEIANAMFKNK